jgi:hypothetical protein
MSSLLRSDGALDANGARPRPRSINATVPSARRDAAKTAESLRQLKALHDECILTDDEYETKRQTLTDRL